MARQSVTTQDGWLVFTGPFNLDHTLCSGQTFRWRRKDGGFEGVIGSSLVEIWQDADALRARTFPVPWNRVPVEEYFCLHDSPTTALGKLDQDRHLAGAIARHPGIRILRQDPWECMASFILAINKGIPHIEKTVASLCDLLGQKIRSGDRVFSLFPTVEAVASAPESLLRSTKMGFRAAYLQAAAKKILREQIDLVGYRKKSYSLAREALMAFHGIGPKVADCICLFSLGHQEAFPVDVWVARAMQRNYGGRKKLSLARAQEMGREKFGPHAGLAQQYLYHDIRMQGRDV